MSKLNLKQPYGVVYGHDTVRYTQEGKNYDAQYREIGTPQAAPEKPAAKVQKTEGVAKATPLDNAKSFLLQVLKENPVSKSAIYKEAENNNHNWNDVKDAFIALNLIKFAKSNLEMWQLPESSSVGS